MSEKNEPPQQKVPHGPDRPTDKDFENYTWDQGSIRDEQPDPTVRDTISPPQPPKPPTDSGPGETGS